MKIKKIVDNLYKIPGSATLNDIYKALPDKKFYVEPLSMNQSLEDFIFEGGTGYNSLKHGRLAKIIRTIRASYDNKPFTYGLPFTTLYAAGYPLQRIIEGSANNSLLKTFERIENITIPVMERKNVKLLWKKSELNLFIPPSIAQNAFYVNDAAANLFGIKKAGFCIVLPEKYKEIDGWELIEEKIWENRFFLDKLDDDTKIMKLFTQKSNIPLIYEKFHEKLKKKDISNLFFVLYARLGILLILSGKESDIEKMWEEVKAFKLTYRLT